MDYPFTKVNAGLEHNQKNGNNGTKTSRGEWPTDSSRVRNDRLTNVAAALETLTQGREKSSFWKWKTTSSKKKKCQKNPPPQKEAASRWWKCSPTLKSVGIRKNYDCANGQSQRFPPLTVAGDGKENRHRTVLGCWCDDLPPIYSGCVCVPSLLRLELAGLHSSRYVCVHTGCISAPSQLRQFTEVVLTRESKDWTGSVCDPEDS